MLSLLLVDALLLAARRDPGFRDRGGNEDDDDVAGLRFSTRLLVRPLLLLPLPVIV